MDAEPLKTRLSDMPNFRLSSDKMESQLMRLLGKGIIGKRLYAMLPKPGWCL